MNKTDYLRDFFKNENLIQYIELVKLSDTTKDTLIKYMNGKSQHELAKEYNVSLTAIHSRLLTAKSNLLKEKRKHN